MWVSEITRAVCVSKATYAIRNKPGGGWGNFERMVIGEGDNDGIRRLKKGTGIACGY